MIASRISLPSSGRAGLQISTLNSPPRRLAPANIKSALSGLISHKMASRLVHVSNHTSRVLPRTTRTFLSFGRHQSTTPQSATPARPLQTQQPAQSQSPVARHPSAVSHPALDGSQPKGGDNNNIVLIFGGLLIACAPLSYWYWGYRERAMKAKKEEMLRGIQERYAARHGSG